MSKKDQNAGLRNRAEAILKEKGIGNPEQRDELSKILHELDVYQIELEIQNQELRETGNALTESRSRYQSLYDFSPLGYATISKEGLILECNLELANLLNRDRGYLISRPITGYIHPNSREKFFLAFTASRDTKVKAEIRVVPHNQEPIYVQIEVIQVEVSSSRDVEYRFAFLDITEKKKLEKSLLDYKENLESMIHNRTMALQKANHQLTTEIEERRQSQIIYNLLVENIPDAFVALFGSDLRIQIAGGKEVRRFGFASSYFVGKKITEALAGDFSVRLEELFQDATRGFPSEKELSFLDQSFKVITIPIKNEQQIIQGGLSIFINITVAKKNREDLAFLNKSLESKVAERTTELLDLNSELQNTLKKNNQIQSRFNHVLAFTSHWNSDSKPISLDSTIREILTILTTTLQTQTRTHTEILYTAEDYNLFLQASASELFQILIQLYSNSLDATRTMERPKIELHTKLVSLPKDSNSNDLSERGSSFANFIFRDNGIGIPTGSLPKIFDPFFSTKGEGYGLGLTLVMGFVKRLHGSITVDSVPNVHTTFSLLIPIAKEANP